MTLLELLAIREFLDYAVGQLPDLAAELEIENTINREIELKKLERKIPKINDEED